MLLLNLRKIPTAIKLDEEGGGALPLKKKLFAASLKDLKISIMNLM